MMMKKNWFRKQFSDLTPEAKKDKLLIFRLIRFLNDGNFSCSHDLWFPQFPPSYDDYFRTCKWRVRLHESKIIEKRYYQQLILKSRKTRRKYMKKHGKYFDAELVFEQDMSLYYAKIFHTDGYRWRKEQCFKRLSKWRKFNKIKIELVDEAESRSERITSASETFRTYKAVKPRALMSNKRMHLHLLSDNINSKSKAICLLMKGVLKWASGSMPSSHSFYRPHKFPLESPACSSNNGLSLRLHIAGY